MKILVTGARGFVGQNLCEVLKAIQDGRDHSRSISIEKVYEFDKNSTLEELDEACKEADFVFNLAGVNRPSDVSEFMKGNCGFLTQLLCNLEKHKNRCPVMLSSSIQATLSGRYVGSPYGQSKLAAERELFAYGERTGAKVLVYRFPNLFGKWCRPNYNSAVATFCDNIANELPVSIKDPSVKLELLYIDDLVSEMLNAIEGHEYRCEFEGVTAVATPVGRYCYASVVHQATLNEIVDLLQQFKKQPKTLVMPLIQEGSFAKKLYSTFLSYLPPQKARFAFEMHADTRGSFTELLKTVGGGQFSVNISKPGITKGQHWHHSKWELFIVVSGRALIQERRIGMDENNRPYPVHSFEVSGDKIEAVHMLPGYTHSITNLSSTDDLVTLIWVNESFNPNHPDTFFEPIE